MCIKDDILFLSTRFNLVTIVRKITYFFFFLRTEFWKLYVLFNVKIISISCGCNVDKIIKRHITLFSNNSKRNNNIFFNVSYYIYLIQNTLYLLCNFLYLYSNLFIYFFLTRQLSSHRVYNIRLFKFRIILRKRNFKTP